MFPHPTLQPPDLTPHLHLHPNPNLKFPLSNTYHHLNKYAKLLLYLSPSPYPSIHPSIQQIMPKFQIPKTNHKINLTSILHITNIISLHINFSHLTRRKILLYPILLYSIYTRNTLFLYYHIVISQHITSKEFIHHTTSFKKS